MNVTKNPARILWQLIALCLPLAGYSQQFKWAQSNGASASLTSHLFISPTTNSTTSNGVAINETYVSFSSNPNRLIGAGVPPDVGIVESNSAKLVRYDANMNIVWVGYTSGYVAADPRANDQFYVAFSSTAASTTYNGVTITGQAAASASFVAKCKATGSLGFTVLWVIKVDGSSDETITQLRVKDIGGGNTRIALSGTTRSPSISNYSNSTTGIVQTAPVNGGGSTAYDFFISAYNDNGTTVAPLWINTFGNNLASESGTMPLEINDDGDVLFAPVYGSNTLGTVNYTLNNSSGAVSPGTVTSTNYSANITNSRYMLFRFDRSTGAPTLLRNEFNAATTFTPQALATDAARNIYMQGQLSSSHTVAPGITITSAGSVDAAVIVLDNAGTPLRAQRYGGTGDDRTSGTYPNSFALDRTNNRMYLTGRSSSATGFTAGTAAVQYINGYTGFLLAANSTGTMSGLSAVSVLSSVSGSSQEFRAVAVRPDGKAIGAQQYAGNAYNRLNTSTANLLPKSSYGYMDVAVTRFDGPGVLLNPEVESTGASSTSNTINGSAIKGNKLLMAGVYNGTMTVGETTITGAGMLLVETDTASGVISQVRSITGTTVTASDVRVSPIDGSIYVCGSTYSDLKAVDQLGKTVMGNRDAFVMKLDASYNHLWTAFIGGVEGDNATGLTLDPVSGDVYIAGAFNSAALYLNGAGGTTWGSSAVATNSNTGLPITADIFVAKFNSSGIFQWIASGGSASTVTNDNIYKGVVYQTGGLYMGCITATNGTFKWGASSLATASTGSAASTDIVLMRLDPATGGMVWQKTWGGNSYDLITSLAAGNGKIYVAGYSGSGAGLVFGGKSFVTVANNDAFVFAVDANGTEHTSFTQLKGSSNDVINEIKTDAVGNIFFAGQTASVNMQVGISTLNTAGSNDLLLGSIDPESMAAKFGFLVGSVQTEGANTITPGSVGMAFPGGNLLGTATFGSQVLNGRLGGDFVYARIDYPFRAPGAQQTSLNVWFKTNASLTGSPATAWQNSSTNATLNTLTSTGTVPVNAAGANYNPSITVTGGSNYLSKTGIFAYNFLDATGSKYSVYTVYKPTANTDRLSLWSDAGSSTGLNLGVTTSVVNGTGGSRSITKTNAVATNQFSLDALVVTGGTMSSYLNGRTNGTQTGVTAVSTSNAGPFQVNGTGTFEVAEVVVYGGAHTAGQPTMNQINSYFALKYGITLNHHYFSTVGDTLFRADGSGTDYLYDSNIAGIAIDSNEVLVQKQGRSQNTAARGNMLTIGMGTIAASNSLNNTPAGSGISYLVWGDNAGSVTSTQTTDMADLVSSCAFRLPREWKINRTGTGIDTTQVQLDLAGTISLSGYAVSDFQLMIDSDGDGDFLTGSTLFADAASFSGNIVTFNKIVWDSDGNGSDVFTLLINNKIPRPTLVSNATAIPTPAFSCSDVAGRLVFVDDPANPTRKYLSIYPNGSTGFNFSVTAVNNSPAINNHMRTNGTTATSALINRMYVINDAGLNNYPSGMRVRLYYNPADSAAAVAALDPAIVGDIYFKWFKKAAATPADVLAAQVSNGVANVSWIVPSSYGIENGVRYVEFSGITSFSTFGSIAIRSSVILPLKLQSFTGTVEACKPVLRWKTAEEQNMRHFEVQYSADGVAYSTLAQVAANNDPLGGNYSWTGEDNLTNGYFRLSMVNADGSSVFSPVVHLNGTGCGGNGWFVMPNPVQQGGELTLRFQIANGAERVTATMTNLQGQDVMTKELRVSGGALSVRLPLTGLPKGTYLLRVNDQKGQPLGKVEKIVVR